MRKRLTAHKVDVNGKTVNVGIDVHKQSWRVTALIEGVVVTAVSIKPSYNVLQKLLGKFKGAAIRVAYEAGPGGFTLYDDLTNDGIECIVVPPSLLPVESGNRVKTDKRDSRKLAHYLESGLLKKVYVLSVQERADRQLVRTRRQMSNHRCSVMRQIKSLLLFHGIALPGITHGSWNHVFIAQLRAVSTDHCLGVALTALIDLYEYLTRQVKQLTKEVRTLSQTEKYSHRVSLLKSIPGIGVLSAMEVLTELQDVSRFSTADKLAAYLGLTPSQHSSGQMVRMGRITHMGNHRLRTVMVESSWHLIKRDPEMHRIYEAIKKRRGSKRAIVAVSRKLIIRIRRILLDGVVYCTPCVAAA